MTDKMLLSNGKFIVMTIRIETDEYEYEEWKEMRD